MEDPEPKSASVDESIVNDEAVDTREEQEAAVIEPTAGSSSMDPRTDEEDEHEPRSESSSKTSPSVREECPVCHKVVVNGKAHQKVCVGPRPDTKGDFACVGLGCSREYSRHADLIRHWRTKHTGPIPEAIKMMKREVRAREICPECGELFLHLPEHIRVIHRKPLRPPSKTTVPKTKNAKKKSPGKPNPFVDTDSSGYNTRKKSSSKDRSGLSLDSSFLNKAIRKAVASDYESPISITDMEARLDEMDTGDDGGDDGGEDDEEVNKFCISKSSCIISITYIFLPVSLSVSTAIIIVFHFGLS